MPRSEPEPTREPARSSVPSSTRILIVDDEEKHSELAEIALQAVGYSTRTVQNPLNVIEEVERWSPDAIILDVRMPGIDGVTLARRLKERQCDAGLLFLTSVRDVGVFSDAMGLADQYIFKRFEPYDLVARVGAVLRNRERLASSSIDSRKPRIDSRKPHINALKGKLFLPDGRTFDVTKREIDILTELLAANGEPVPNEELKRAVWGEYEASNPSNATLQANVLRLRKKIERDPSRPELIVLVPNVGYRFVLDS